MASRYGVGVMNRYELFADDESDPLDAFRAMEQLREEEERKRKEKKLEAEKEATKVAKAAPNRKAGKVPQENRRTNGSAPKVEKENRRNEYEERSEEKSAPRGESPRGENRRGKPRRNSDDRRGKREFDRQSGSDKTGVKPVDKKEGAGSHNWGSHKDLIEEAERSTVEEEQPDKDVEETPASAVEEKIEQFTLEEWKATRTNRIKPQYNIRKAGEGEDLSQWKNMYALNKKAERDDETEDEEYDPMDFPQRVGRQKHVHDINFYFNDGRRGGAFRGGRGGRGRRDGRRFDNNQSDGEHPSANSVRAPRVDDERAFPSLA